MQEQQRLRLKYDFSHRKDKGRLAITGQFHQHFMSSFGANIILPKDYKANL
jgi:hypothetical protein